MLKPTHAITQSKTFTVAAVNETKMLLKLMVKKSETLLPCVRKSNEHCVQIESL